MGEATLAFFFESWPLFRESVLSATFAGGLLGALGVTIILGRMVFLSASLSQMAGLGVVLAFYAQLHLGATGLLGDPTIGASVATGLTLLLVMLDRSEGGIGRDSLLGLAFLLGSAGSIVVGTKVVQEVQDIETLLFGTAVAVLPEDFELVVGVTAVVGLIHLVGWRGFSEVFYDRDGSRVRGLPTRGLEVVLLATLAVAISVCTRVLGALPAFAFSVLPAMAAVRLAPNAGRAMVLAALFGASMGFWGYVASFLYDWPVGASQTLIGIGLVATAEVARRAIGWGRALLERRA